MQTVHIVRAMFRTDMLTFEKLLRIVEPCTDSKRRHAYANDWKIRVIR